MDEALFTGVAVALVTLFDDTGDVDLKGTAELARQLVDDGVSGIVIAGSTGEAATLDPTERIAIIETVRSAVDGRVPTIAGTGAPSARQAARLTADACAAGAEAVLVLPPPGAAADQVGYYREVVAAAHGTPVLGYHFPLMSAPGLDAGGAAPADRGRRCWAEGFLRRPRPDSLRTLVTFDGWLYVGSPWLLSAAGPLGATGAILAVANVEPALSIAAFAGDVEAQRRLTPSNARATGPAGIKGLLAERSGRSARTRV